MDQIQLQDSVMSPKEDAIDVEFETIAAQNTSENTPNAEVKSAPRSVEPIDSDQLAVFGQKSGQTSNKALSLPVFTLIAAICSVGAFYLAGGHILFGASSSQSTTEPPSLPAVPVDEKTLKIENVTSNTIERSNLKVLTIRATIANYDTIARTVPTIIVRLGDDPATGRMFRINRGETLEAGERLVFTNSLPLGNAPATQPKLTFAE